MTGWRNPIMKALDETGLPWQVETGKGHKKIRLCGRLVGVMSTNQTGTSSREMMNVICQIKRAAKEMRK